jgi:glycosyltransferase involved in cell wall biosynthesis
MTAAVSVIVPTFNRRAMAIEAVDSVLSQRGTSFELIVIDDGSTDGTADALFELRRARGVPFAIERAENRGPAAARNLGVALASAAMIAFLDSDDLWMPDKLARQIAFMREHSEYKISQCEEIWIRDGRRVNPGKRHRKRAGDIFTDSLRTCLISPSAVIMHAKLFQESGGFDETMAAAEDYDLWLRILVGHEVGLIDAPLVTRRSGHADQLSTAVPAIDRFRILALTKLLGYPLVAGARRQAAASVLAQKCAIYAAGLARRGRRDEARYYEQVAARALGKWTHCADGEIAASVAEMRAMIERQHRAEHRPGTSVCS